jgi:membrane fusion protein, multidrug efflux system
MSSEHLNTPSPRRLLLVGAAALVVAGAVAATGIISRANGHQELRQWTAQQAMPTVALAKLEHGNQAQSLVLPGNIQPYYKALIYARVSGYLKTWDQDIGAHVKAGQLLALVDTPDLDQQLDQAKADLATAAANEQLAALTAKRWNGLVASQAVSRQSADEKTGDAAAKKAIVDATQANVRRLEALESFKRIVAPFDGVVTARNTDVGALINAGSGAGQALFEVSDLHKVRIYVQIPQAFAAELQPGMKTTFEMPQSPGQQFEARLVTTSNAMEVNSRTMLVELQADNSNGKLFAGTYCQVHFHLSSDPNVVRVPATALVPVDHGMQVAVLGDGDKVALKTVHLGRDLGDSVEVVAGISPSDRVIDSPPETLRSGDTVRLAATTAPPASKDVAARAPAAKAN